jgi:hypothetical protein
MRDSFLFVKDIDGDDRYYVHLELADKELQAIGLVTAQWSLLEHLAAQYAEFLCAGLGIQVPKEITSYSHRKRLRAWKILVGLALKGHPDHDASLKVVSKMANMLGDRHDVIHGLLQWQNKNKAKLEVHTRNNKQGPKVVDLAWLEKFARNIACLNVELMWVHGPELAPFGERRISGTPALASQRPGPALPQETLESLAIPQVRKPRRSASPGSSRPKRAKTRL